jgi:conserved hypothetical protein TIGR00043
MTLNIDYRDETGQLKREEIETVLRLLEEAARTEGLEGECELSLTFVDNDTIREINRDYRGIDRPTDVISFALEETLEGELPILGDGLPRVLGDIIISIPKAREQAESYGHSFLRELGFLAVHGFLHLLGYDHRTKEEETEMFTRQEGILQSFGLKR